ncbi:MAG: type II secretion system protein GspG [Phycisphaerales bacterium]|nr:type II secretion system protein GspG [Phycisphaerales bacterium]
MNRTTITARRLLALAALLAPAAAAQTDSPYLRVVEPDEHTIRLDVAVRTLVPTDAAHPIVQLVGAVHIADAPFYADIQSFLDVHDLVLYEGVGGGRESVPEPDGGDQAAALTTARRAMFLAMLGEARAREGDGYPTTTGELIEGFDGAMRDIVAGASRDGWGRQLVVENGDFDVLSLGADGQVGGGGADADIRGRALLDNPPAREQSDDAAGLQRDLADALGLTFQLDGIDYSHPHWRNSDMDFGEITEALGGTPAAEGEGDQGKRGRLDPDAPDKLKAADALFNTLSGESFMAKASSFILKMLGSNPTGRAMVKIMLADTLTQADQLLAMQPGGLAELMDVIIKDRNAAVIRDLTAVIDDEPEVRTVAIFYGAGHFGDLESGINDQLGYEYESTVWIPAITIDLRDAGLSAKQVSFYRTMMKQMIDSQMEMMKNQK